MATYTSSPTEDFISGSTEASAFFGETYNKPIISLKKPVISNNDANHSLDRDFRELTKTGTPPKIKHFFETYDRLFYKIEKETAANKETHYNLVHESNQYIRDYIDFCQVKGYTQEVKCDEEIEHLLEGLELINSQSYAKESQLEHQNLLYSNGTVLRGEGVDEFGMPVFIMVQGKKRKISDLETYETAKRALGHLPDAPEESIRTQLSFEELSSIPSGPDINSDIDLILVDQTAEDEIDPEITLGDIFDWRESIFVCLCGAGTDPDEAINLSNVFGGGAPLNNGTENGQCRIIYFDLDSQLKTLNLNVGEKTQKIRHRVQLLNSAVDAQGNPLLSVPAAYSDSTTPIQDAEGNVNIVDHSSGKYNGVYIKGFTREIRFWEGNDLGENTLTPNYGTEILLGGDVTSLTGELYGDGIPDIIHSIEQLSDDYGDHTFDNMGNIISTVNNFSVFYYNINNTGLARFEKRTNISVSSPSAGDFLSGGRKGSHTIPSLNMITDGGNGQYVPFPPKYYPGSNTHGTYGYKHNYGSIDKIGDITNAPYSLANIKSLDYNFVQEIFNKPDSVYYDTTFTYTKCLPVGGYGDVCTTSQILGQTSGLGFNGYFITYKTYVDGGISPSEAARTVFGHKNYSLGGVRVRHDSMHGGIHYLNQVIYFDLHQRFDTSNSWSPHWGWVYPHMVYGAPVFEYQGIYFTIGRELEDGCYHGGIAGSLPSCSNVDNMLTYLPLYYDETKINTNSDHHEARNKLCGPNGVNSIAGGKQGILFRQLVKESSTNKYDDGGFTTRVANALSLVMQGQPQNTPSPAGSKNVRCVFPGFDHVYYQDYINNKHQNGNTPWNASGDVRSGGMEKQLDPDHVIGESHLDDTAAEYL